MFILVLAFIAAIILLAKSITKKDISILGGVLSRIYLAVVIGIYLFTPIEINMDFIHIGVAIMLASDITTNALFFFSRKYRIEIENARLLRLLKELGDKYATVVENALVGFYVMDKHGALEYVNPHLCEMVGYTKNEIIGKTIFDFTPKEEHAIIKEKIDNRINGKSKKECYSIHLISRSGKLIYVKVLGSLTSNGHPTISGTCLEVNAEGGCSE